MYSAVTWSDFGIIVRLLWVYEGGFGLLLGDFGITLDVVAGLMVSWCAPSGPILEIYRKYIGNT